MKWRELLQYFGNLSKRRCNLQPDSEPHIFKRKRIQKSLWVAWSLMGRSKASKRSLGQAIRSSTPRRASERCTSWDDLMWEIRTAGQHDFHASTAQLNIETSPNACRHFLPLAKASHPFFFQHSRQLGSTTAHPAAFSAS
jgi:hypothetical protein